MAGNPGRKDNLVILDIIPDVHGQASKLETLLHRMGWTRTTSGRWTHVDGHRLVLLGHLVDRGPEQIQTLHTARELVESEVADIVMGNHEWNALLFHLPNPKGGFLRPHTPSNVHQHKAFLDAFAGQDSLKHTWLDWLATLPFWHTQDRMGFVHACWDERAMKRLGHNRLNTDWRNDPLTQENPKTSDTGKAIEILLKGPEMDLPHGLSYADVGGHIRDTARIAWWNPRHTPWPLALASMPDNIDLPDDITPVADDRMPPEPQTVTGTAFGHYWLPPVEGHPLLMPHQGKHLCLDFSAALPHAPLVGVRVDSEAGWDVDRGHLPPEQVFVAKQA